MTTERIYTTTHSPLGELTLVALKGELCGVYFEQQRYFKGVGSDGIWQRDDRLPLFTIVKQQLQLYFEGKLTQFDVPLALAKIGTPFQRQVWQTLLSIEHGTHISYGELAQRINNPKAIRAVGSAIGRNPISIIIPCHRVLASNGALTGYSGGVDKKRFLLALEKGR